MCILYTYVYLLFIYIEGDTMRNVRLWLRFCGLREKKNNRPWKYDRRIYTAERIKRYEKKIVYCGKMW